MYKRKFICREVSLASRTRICRQVTMIPINMSFSLLSILVIGILVNGISGGVLQTRLIGGDNADSAEFPHQVSLRYEGRHYCGGTIISTKHILTAAHCVIDFVTLNYNFDDLTVITGTNSLARGGDTYGVRNITYHGSYIDGQETSWQYDIADRREVSAGKLKFICL